MVVPLMPGALMSTIDQGASVVFGEGPQIAGYGADEERQLRIPSGRRRFVCSGCLRLMIFMRSLLFFPLAGEFCEVCQVYCAVLDGVFRY